MRLSIRVIFGAALLAGCASAPPRVAQPIVLDFEWEPPFTEQTTAFGQPKALAQREDMMAVVARNLFDTRFQEVVLDGDQHKDAPARVTLKVAEVPVTTTARPVPAERVVPGAVHRCGTVYYSVFVGGRETSRDEIALECNPNGLPEYDRAILRAADAAAKALSQS